MGSPLATQSSSTCSWDMCAGGGGGGGGGPPLAKESSLMCCSWDIYLKGGSPLASLPQSVVAETRLQRRLGGGGGGGRVSFGKQVLLDVL